jgi:hypothetical protein
LLSALKLVISIPDHSLSVKYRDWSGIINLEGSNGCSNGYRYGDGLGQGEYGMYLGVYEMHL